MSYTKEPWPSFASIDINEGYGKSIIISKDDYIRARACVNACAGIQTEHLEEVHGTFGTVFLEAREKVSEYKDQRDKLLAALKAVLPDEKYADMDYQPNIAAFAIIKEVEATL